MQNLLKSSAPDSKNSMQKPDICMLYCAGEQLIIACRAVLNVVCYS
jgi:hypothetical protein